MMRIISIRPIASKELGRIELKCSSITEKGPTKIRVKYFNSIKDLNNHYCTRKIASFPFVVSG